METAESIKQRLHTAEELHSLVRTMKTMAAVNIRHLEKAVVSLADYQDTVELGLRVVLKRNPRVAVAARIRRADGWRWWCSDLIRECAVN